MMSDIRLLSVGTRLPGFKPLLYLDSKSLGVAGGNLLLNSVSISRQVRFVPSRRVATKISSSTVHFPCILFPWWIVSASEDKR